MDLSSKGDDVLDFPQWCQCSISGEVMHDPVIIDAACLHTVNRSSAQRWNKDTCPVCLTPVRSQALSPNVPLRDAIHHFFGCDYNRTHHKVPLAVWHSYQSQLGIRVCKIHAEQKIQIGDGDKCPRCRNNNYVHEYNDTMEGILNLMRNNADHTQLQAQGCKVLARMLAKDECNSIDKKDLVEKEQLFLLIFAAIKDHQFTAAVTYQAFRVLRFLPFWNKAHAKQIVDQAGGIRTVIHIMKTYPSHAGIQRYACWILYGLSSYYDAAAMKVVMMSGVDNVEQARQEHPNDLDVQFESKRLLQVLQNAKKGTPWFSILRLSSSLPIKK